MECYILYFKNYNSAFGGREGERKEGIEWGKEQDREWEQEWARVSERERERDCHYPVSQVEISQLWSICQSIIISLDPITHLSRNNSGLSL